VQILSGHDTLLGTVPVGLQIIVQYSKAYTVEASADIKPDTLDVKRQGKWIAAYITLEGFNISDINQITILLEDLFEAECGEIQGDVLTVKFDAFGVTSHLEIMLSHLDAHKATVNLLM
jgi:hypothetical protein